MSTSMSWRRGRPSSIRGAALDCRRMAAHGLDDKVVRRREGRDGPTPSELYPGGFSVAPLALMKHPDTKAKHIAVFVAIYTLARPWGDKLQAREAHKRRIMERAGIGSRNTLDTVLKDLEAWGFIEIQRHQGFPSTYVLLPIDTDVSDALKADRDEDHLRHPDVAAHRGGRPQTNPPRKTARGDRGAAEETPRAELAHPLPESARGPSVLSR